MKVLRWIAVPFVAVIVFCLTWWIGTRTAGRVLLYPNNSHALLFDALSSAVAVAASVYFAMQTAPSHKIATGIICSIVIACIAIVSAFYCFYLGIQTHWRYLVCDVALIAASGLTIYNVRKSESAEKGQI